MAVELEIPEKRLKSFLCQLQAEYEILDRIVYKNKNQHRRSSYFQYLLKVRRDLKLFQAIHLEELLDSCFNVVTGKKAKQKANLLESLKRKKCDSGKFNFIERLKGAARLLSEMVEPMLKAATHPLLYI
ncbi:Slowpoke-binding protein [Bienertia sinuspersici]